KAVKNALGDLPVTALEKPAEILAFKAAFRPGHTVATVNCVLGVLRAAINWGRFQDPPLLSTTPFHRFGVSIKAREATKRDRRIPFDPHGRLAPILKRRATLGPQAFVFGSTEGEFQDSFKTAWESLLLVACGHDTTREKPGARVDRAKLRQIDLHWHDLRHE